MQFDVNSRRRDDRIVSCLKHSRADYLRKQTQESVCWGVDPPQGVFDILSLRYMSFFNALNPKHVKASIVKVFQLHGFQVETCRAFFFVFFTSSPGWCTRWSHILQRCRVSRWRRSRRNRIILEVCPRWSPSAPCHRKTETTSKQKLSAHDRKTGLFLTLLGLLIQIYKDVTLQTKLHVRLTPRSYLHANFHLKA